ncbi:MAG: hypothetical protein DRP42_02780 [Tenericutes bacterium]|nr:MAG: hypothetical protein DRP42_02780 [Mycoplasmatota bacterium]
MSEKQVYPICDKCGTQNEGVMCYEGFGVGIRLCRDKCDIDYLKNMKQHNEAIGALKNEKKAEIEAFKANVKGV